SPAESATSVSSGLRRVSEPDLTLVGSASDHARRSTACSERERVLRPAAVAEAERQPGREAVAGAVGVDNTAWKRRCSPATRRPVRLQECPALAARRADDEARHRLDVAGHPPLVS